MNETATGRLFDLSQPICNIVCAYVAKNRVAWADLPALIASVHSTLSELTKATKVMTNSSLIKLTSAQIYKSITPDSLISFIDGKPYKTLKRHLTKHGHNPDSYREQFGLPGDYPMVSASYSARRSDLARTYGIGSEYNRSRQADAASLVTKGRRKGARPT